MSNILVVGSLVVDHCFYTSIFPEQGETVFGNNFKKGPGGKGANQAVQAARLGSNVSMIGKLGNDSNAELMLNACKESNVDTERIMIDDNSISSCCTIIVEETDSKEVKNRIIVIPGANMEIKLNELKYLEKEIKNYDLIMLQLEIPMEINEYVASLAYANNVPVMLNPAPYAMLPNSLLSKITYFSPNEHEVYGITGIKIPHNGEFFDENKAQEAANVLHQKGIKNVLITLGNAGSFFSNGNEYYHTPCINEIKAVDSAGAGDSFIGAFSHAIVSKMEIKEALKFANYTASITVSRHGTMPSLPTIAEVNQLLIDFSTRLTNNYR